MRSQGTSSTGLTGIGGLKPRGPVAASTTRAGLIKRELRMWHEVADGVMVRRYTDFNLSIGLIKGEDAVLVVDTRGSERQGRALMDEISWITNKPMKVVNTHYHFDHAFGNQPFVPAEIWGHESCATRLVEEAHATQYSLAAAMPEVTFEYTETRVAPPNRTFRESARIELGGREVLLQHFGRGHTDNDVVVIVPDVHTMFVGDLVEQGAPPSFADAFPLDWATTLQQIVNVANGPVVPGHGDVVRRAFVEAQMHEHAALASLALRIRFDGSPIENAIPFAPFPPEVSRLALHRAMAQLDGSEPKAS